MAIISMTSPTMLIRCFVMVKTRLLLLVRDRAILRTLPALLETPGIGLVTVRASPRRLRRVPDLRAVLRLRPIMMTMLVAILGLLPAALSRAIGSDSQRPFAIVIVGGLISALLMGIFLLPAMYVWIARDGDKLPEAEESFEM